MDSLLRVFDALRTVHEGKPIDSFNDDITYKNRVVEVRTVRKQEGRAGKNIRHDCRWRVRRAGAGSQEWPCHEAGRAPSAVVRTRTLPHPRTPTPLPPTLRLLTQEPCKHTIHPPKTLYWAVATLHAALIMLRYFGQERGGYNGPSSSCGRGSTSSFCRDPPAGGCRSWHCVHLAQHPHGILPVSLLHALQPLSLPLPSPAMSSDRVHPSKSPAKSACR